ncbi:MAG: type II toxin-antitoxin system VapC family toxin [Burkholderiales bacterium]
MILTLDASVVVKWHVASPRERDSEQAILLLDAVLDGSLKLVEPPHALAEIAAVLSRVFRDDAKGRFDEVARIFASGRTFLEESAYLRAIEISRELDHHLFDTLYHAAAIESGGILITADERYFRKAEKLGGILLLERISGTGSIFQAMP